MKKRLLLISLTVSMILMGGQFIFAASKPFEDVTLQIPNMAGWRNALPIWANEKLFTEETGAKWLVTNVPHVNLYSKQLTELVAGTQAYDLIMGLQMSFGVFRPYAMSLNKFIISDYGSIDNFKKMFYRPGFEAGVYNGQVKFIPFQHNVQYLVYREDLFNDVDEKKAFKTKYGYELRPPQTLKELVDVAEFFTRPLKDMWGLVIMGKSAPGGWHMISALFGAGLELVEPETKKPSFAGGSSYETAVKVAKFWYDMIHTHKVMPPGTGAIGHTEAYDMYAAGRAAMGYGWFGDYQDKITSAEIITDIGKTGYAPLPTMIPDGKTTLGMFGYGIPKNCKNPEAAWAYVKFVLSEKIQTEMIKTGMASPIKKYTEKAIGNNVIAWVYKELLPRTKLPPRDPKSQQVCQLYWRYSDALFSGSLTPKEYIGKMIKETEEIEKK